MVAKKIDTTQIDIRESDILSLDRELLEILIIDRSSNNNILWATDNYEELGDQFSPESPITIESITGEYSSVVQPRIKKSREVQESRSKDKAEVFTPSWICNKQNNLIDNAFFGREGVFNTETEDGWISKDTIEFLENENWRDYVKAKRLEITCGEAPYITSRYDATTGELIEPLNRVGILDRKFKVVHQVYGGAEFSVQKWFKWIKIALQSTYGYEWQGDNLLLARENILLTFIDFYQLKFPGKFPTITQLREVANIISWNIWQMDGLKMVIPNTCHDSKVEGLVVPQLSLFGDTITQAFTKTIVEPCPGCKNEDVHRHNGIQCKIRDWFTDKGTTISLEKGVVPFHTLISK